jgi:hypothetical protein
MDDLRRRPALLAGVLVLAALAVIGLALLLTSGQPQPEPTVAPEPEQTVEPDPEPEPPDPVAGEVDLLRVTDLSVSGRRVFGESMPQNDPVEADQAQVDVFVSAMAGWLDDHLTSLQDGGAGLVFETDLVGPHEALTLSTPELPVAHARYEMVVWAREAPEWGSADVTVALVDGSSWRSRFVFAPGEPLALVAAVGDGPVPAAGSPDGSTETEEGS